MSTANPSRLATLATQIRTLIKELSGVSIEDDAASFMELGFDSLFLTQVSQAVQGKFGTKITFRQMLSDLSTVSLLASYLDKTLPADQAITPKPAAAAPAPIAVAAHAPAAIPAGSSPLEALLATQMQLMQAVLAQNKQQPAAVAAAPAARPGLSTVKWPGANPPAGNTTTATGEFKRFGPYKPVEKGEKGGLTARQQTALDALIERYVRKTAASKAYTAEHRPHFADPRAVSGFKSNWKEMVYPIVSARSKGSKIWDIDGHEYIDITMGFGTYFFGHSPDWLMPTLEEQLRTGIEIGPQNPLAGKVAALVTEFTGLERVTFCNTGSEAVMAAMRLARTVTGRNRIVYFSGDYHGMFEEVLVRSAWVNGEYRSQPIAPGIPPGLVENLLVLEYGAPESLEIIKTHAHEIAAVLVEPVQSRNPALQPKEFMHALRDITQRTGSALIFDEVVTGFRCHPGGAQAYFGIKADLATYGKVIGGGVPIGVLAGIPRYMDALDGGAWNYGDDSFPEVGMTFFAGTFVRNPLAMAAAYRVLNYLKEQGPELQQRMTERVARFCRELDNHFEQIGVPIRLPHFSAFAVIEHAHDLKYASLLWYFLRERGIHVWEGRPLYFTLAHTDEDFDGIIRAFKDAVTAMQEAGFLPESKTSSNLQTPPTSGQTEYPRHDSSPITEAQQEIFLSVQMSNEANCSYNEASLIEFTGALDPAALRTGLIRIFDRHPALRSKFSEDGARQIFHPTQEVFALAEESLEGLTTAEAEKRFAALCAAETSTPFNLIDGPVVRLKLVRFAPDRHQLIFTAHHIVCDGWSFGMIVAEFATLYNAAKVNRVPLLPPAMSFGDYARHLAKTSASDEAKKSEEYWLKTFSNGAPTLEIPTDRPRPALKTYAAAMETRRISDALFARVKKAAPSLGGTVFSTLLGTFATLMHRLTGQDDIVIGIPAAGQVAIGCNELVGHCLNFLPMRLQVSADATFAKFASAVKTGVLDAYDHQNITYGTLVQKLKLPRDTSRLPLVSVMFNIDKSGFDFVSFDGLKFDVASNAKQFTNFELFFNLVQTETSLEVECEFNTDLFDRSTIAGWLESFETLIEAVVSNAATKLGQLPLLGAADAQNVQFAWNQTERDFPRNKPLQALFVEQAQRAPTRTAVRCGTKSLTYAELDKTSNQLAAHLQSLGAKPGKLVGVCVERSVEMVVAVLGILKSGAAYVPIDPAFPADRIAMMVEDARMEIIVTQNSVTKILPASNARLVDIETPLAASTQPFVAPSQTGEDLAYVIFTSGSTGRPKGVQIPHRAVVNFLASMRREPGLTQDDILLSVTTLSFDIAGLELHLPLTTGATVVIATRETAADGSQLLAELDRTAATVMQATPVTWRLLLEAGWKASPKLKILIGGEAVPRDLVNQLLPRCASLWNVYGPTETTIWSTTTRLAAGEGAVSIGRPIDNTQTYIVNSHLQLQPAGIPGELLIGGDGVALGYLDRPELTAEKFIADPFGKKPGAKLYRTGDIARWRPDGTLECLGRVDFQVKLRGFRIELGEIEAALEKHPAVAQAVVALREDQPGEKRLVGYVVAKTTTAPTPAELRDFLASRLPNYMIPAVFMFPAALPLTPNGKVDRRALQAPTETARTARVVVAPRSPTEQTLFDIWQQVLQGGPFGVTDDIFDLGGDSIAIFKIAARAKQLGLALTPATLFRHRTIAELAALNTTPLETGKPPPIAGITRANRDLFKKKASA